jgi:hypothetical protein
VGYVSVTLDSSYVFPITNYQSSLLETRTAGDNQQVSEVVKLGESKLLYRLKVDESKLRRRNVNAKPTEYMRKLIEEDKKTVRKEAATQQAKSDSAKKKEDDFFNSEFGNEKTDSSKQGKVVESDVAVKEPVLKKAKLYEYRPPKFFNDYLVTGFNNNVLVTRYQPYTGGTSPVQLSNNDPLSGITRVGTSDLFEDWKIAGGFRLSPNLDNNEYVFTAQYLKKKIDYGITYYRSGQLYGSDIGNVKLYSNLYQGTVSYPFNKVKSLRMNVGVRSDKFVYKGNDFFVNTLTQPDEKQLYGLAHIEYVHDDAITPAMNIWNGLRWKIYMDFNARIKNSAAPNSDHPTIFNAGVDARHYLPIYRNIIWAVRAAADFSWGNEKIIYYLGGIDNWLMFGGNQKVDPVTGAVKYKYFNEANRPLNNYTYQSLAVNMRGYIQNIAHGNNAVVINSEVRVPVFTSFFNKPINNAFLRNFQLVQFIDLGTAWDGAYNKIERPNTSFSQPGSPIAVNVKAGGIGPFAGGYGFGARSTLLGYFIRFDAAWQMNSFFKGKPKYYVALGLDF